jgi:hypothetical protein
VKTSKTYELIALTTLGALSFVGIILVLLIARTSVDKDGQVLGAAIAAFSASGTIIFQAIRNLGQSVAMESLVDHLSKSAPVTTQEIVPEEESVAK